MRLKSVNKPLSSTESLQIGDRVDGNNAQGLFVLAGLTLALIHYIASYIRQGTLFVGGYWTGFYSATYQDGFRRRALIGSICRLISPSGVSVLAINLIALATLCALLFLVARSFLELEPGTSNRAALFSFALFASPMAGISVEVLGDTLQIAFVLFFSGMFLLNKYAQRRWLVLAGGFGLITLGFLIHEASIFFLVPTLPFLIAPAPRARNFILPTLLLAGLLLVSAKWSHLNPHPSYPVLAFPHNRQLVGLVNTPDFKTLLGMEKENFFTSARGILRLFVRLSRPFALGFVSLTALAISLKRNVFSQFLFTFTVILCYCLPLWVVAHDWGRFLCYAFFLAVIATSFQSSELSSGRELAPAWASNRAIALKGLSADGFVQAGALFALLDRPEWDMQTKGLGTRDVVALAGILTIGFIAARSSFMRRVFQVRSHDESQAAE